MDELEHGLEVMGEPGELCGGDGQECCTPEATGAYACGAGLTCVAGDWGPLLCQPCAQARPLYAEGQGPPGVFKCLDAE